MKKVEHLIKEVYPGSIAEELEIEPGDVLLSINDQSIEDVFDYRYMIKDEYIEVLIRKPDGEEWVLEIDKDYDDDLGIEFENQLMSDYKSCSNKCIFCFIDQMPPNIGIITACDPTNQWVSKYPAKCGKYNSLHKYDHKCLMDSLFYPVIFSCPQILAGISRHSHACTQHRNIGQFLDSSCRNMRRHNLRTKSVYCRGESIRR